MSSFRDLRIVDNFYQTSSYIPMPTVLVSTVAEDGSTSVGAYSLCFPYYIARGKVENGERGCYALITQLLRHRQGRCRPLDIRAGSGDNGKKLYQGRTDYEMDDSL